MNSTGMDEKEKSKRLEEIDMKGKDLGDAKYKIDMQIRDKQMKEMAERGHPPYDRS